MKFIFAALLSSLLLVSHAGGEPNAFGREHARDEANKDTVKRVFESLLGDQPLQIVISGQLPDVLAPDVRGRVNPVGVFNDLSGVIEYFYGLGGAAANPTTFVSEVNFPYILADENTVFARSDVTYHDMNGVKPDFNITLWGFYRFNDEGTISSFDISAVNLGKTLDPPVVGRDQFINELCGGAMQACQGVLGVYDSFEECVGFMKTLPFGTYDQAHSNTPVCRSIHLGLAFFRPDIHCAHVSKTGGGKCVDEPISVYYEKAY